MAARTNYHNAFNSYLNEVIDDREGLPITLSLLYMELAEAYRTDGGWCRVAGSLCCRCPSQQMTRHNSWMFSTAAA